MMKNPVCDVLNIKYPIIQGAMAWVATAPLAAAVSNAGGLGVLGVGFAPPEIIRDQIRKTRELTDKPFAANIFMIPAMLKNNNSVFLEEKPPVVYVDILGGLNEELAKDHFSQWHEAGMKIVFKASYISDAIIAERAGADVIIVKGWEGGGHVTDESTMCLVPQAAEIIKAPLVASGGICDGRGMAASIILGAQGIEMGSAFCIAEETAVHQNYKLAILAAGDMSTAITGLVTGEPCRQIANNLSKTVLEIEATHLKKEAIELVKKVSEGSLRKACSEGDVDNGAVMIGQIVPLLKKIRPAKEIIEDTILQCQRLLGSQMNLGI